MTYNDFIERKNHSDQDGRAIVPDKSLHRKEIGGSLVKRLKIWLVSYIVT